MKELSDKLHNSEWDLMVDHSYRISSVTPNNDLQVDGMNLVDKWTVDIKDALVIKNSPSQQAVTSADKCGLRVRTVDSYDLTTILPAEYQSSVVFKNIVAPPGHPASINKTSWHYQVRNMNHRLEYKEISRIFDHMSAWNHIITVSRVPTIILEADVFLHSALPVHLPRNSVIGLDTGGQLHIHNKNYRVMPGVWAYSIDVSAARRMFNRVLEQGIREPLELMFRADQQLIVLGSMAKRP